MARKTVLPQPTAPTAGETRVLNVRPLRMETLSVLIIGASPYVQHRFSKKAQDTMIKAQEAGQKSKNKRTLGPKDFAANCKGATHFSSAGWIGIPAPSFRNAMISACKTIGYKMTHAKLGLFVKADGFDAEDGTPLVRIYGPHRMHIMPARNANGGADMRARPMWEPGWTATVSIKFDADMFSDKDVLNLLSRVGQQVGIGEGRPDSRNSAGLGWGLFDLKQG